MSTNLHPTVAQFLAPFAPQAQQFRAECGRRRVYLSEGDARAYEAGYRDHPNTPREPLQPSPAWDGFFDKEEEVLARDAERRARAEIDE
jgi:hypothetical protein